MQVNWSMVNAMLIGMLIGAVIGALIVLGICWNYAQSKVGIQIPQLDKTTGTTCGTVYYKGDSYSFAGIFPSDSAGNMYVNKGGIIGNTLIVVWCSPASVVTIVDDEVPQACKDNHLTAIGMDFGGGGNCTDKYSKTIYNWTTVPLIPLRLP